MDEYPDEHLDEDTSLVNLHYGLDSSLDENASGTGKQDLSAKRCADPSITHREKVVAENQMNLLQDMVLEMKEGFQTALEELMKIQVKEEAEANHSKKLQQQQQEQLAHLTETIGEIKHQLSSLTKSVEQIKDEQRMLKDSLEEVRSNRDSSQEHKLNSDRSNLPDDFSSHSEECNSKLSELPAGFGDHNVMTRTDEDVIAIACKSLSLTQALGEECRRFNLSQSSGDDEEDQGVLRLSNYRQNQAHLVQDQMVDRQHNLSVYTGLQDRNKIVSSTVQRQRAVTELADSERDYCSQLWSLRHTYLTSLQTAGLLSTRELDTLIPPYLDQLYTEHCHICSELQDRLLHWTFMSTVSDLLSRVVDSYNSDSLLSLYQEYANDLPVALSFLRRALAQSSEFRLFLKAIKHSSCQSEDLMSLLLTPVQRIPKYLLQVQEISRQTPPSHADFSHLQSLLRQLQSFVDQLNDLLFITTEDLNLDRHGGLDFLNGHLLSARDSRVHSTSAEDDNFISTRSFYKTRSHMPSEWIESPYHSAHKRQTLASPGRISSLSHSDLTAYNNTSNVTSDPLMFTHIPRSQSLLPAADDIGHNSNNPAARQRIQKFKIKMRSPSPARYPVKTQDCTYSTVSTEARPASSVDFLRHHNHQQQKHPHSPDHSPEQSRGYQRPVPQPRSHSALGLQAMSSSHKPVVISRKNIKRPQSNVRSPSGTFMDESISPAIPSTQLNPQRTHSAVNNLQAMTHQTSSILNDHHDEEDDTRTSNTTSLGTSRSYQLIHGQDLNGGHESELDLAQSCVDSQSSQNKVRDLDFSHSLESVSADFSQKFNNTQQEITSDDSILMKQVDSNEPNSKTGELKEQPFKPSENKMKDNQLSKPSINQIKEQQSSRISTNQIKVIQPLRPLTNQIKENQPSRISTNQTNVNQPSRHSTNQNKIQEQSLILSRSKDIDKSVCSFALDPKQDYGNSSVVLPVQSCFNMDDSVSPVSLAEHDFSEGGHGRNRLGQERNERSNVVHGRNERIIVVQGRNENSLVQERNGSMIVQGSNETNSLIQGKNEKSSHVSERNESNHLQGRSEMNRLVQRRKERSYVQGRNESSLMKGRIDRSLEQGRNEGNIVQERNKSSLLQGRNENSIMQGGNESSLEQGRNEGSSAQGRNGDSFVQERNESSSVQRRDGRNNVIKAISNFEKIVQNVDTGAKMEKPAQVSENNRQFLMSLTSRASFVEKTNLNKTFPVTSTETDTGNLSSINSHSHFRSEPDESINQDLKANSCLAEPHPPPRSSKVGSSHFSQVPDMESPQGKANTKPALPPKKHLQTSVSSSPESGTNGARASPDSASSLSSLKHGSDVNQSMSSSNWTYLRSPSALSNETCSLSERTSNHQSPIKLNPLFSSSTTHAINVTAHTSKTSTTLSGADRENGYNDLISYDEEQDLQPISMADLQYVEGKMERRTETARKDLKDEGNVTNTDSLMMPNDDHTNIRKKSHFKASLKNLFAKKKGRVILADVEKEVLREMATAASRPSDKTAALKNIKFSRNKIMRNLGGSNFLISNFHACTPVTETALESRNRKDQASSTSSPVKVSRKFNFCLKQDDTLHPCSAPCSGFNCTGCEQLLLQKNTVEHIKTNIKQHDRILELTDKDEAEILDGSVASGCSMGQVSCTKSHLYTQENNIYAKSQLIKLSVTKSPLLQQSFAESQHCQKSVTKPQYCQQSLTKLPYCQQCLSESPHSQQSHTESPLSQQSLTESTYSQQSLIESHCQQSLTKSPPFQQSLTKSPPFQQSLTKSPPSQQSLTKSPPSQQNLTKSPPSQQSLTKPPPSQHSLTKSPPSEQSFNKSPPSQQSLTKSPPSQQSLIESQQWQQSVIKSPPWQQSITQLHPFQQLPHSEISVNSTVNDVKLHNNLIVNLDKRILSGHCQNQNNQKNIAEIRKPVSNKTHFLKSAPSICYNGHHICVHSKDKADDSSISEGRVIPCQLKCQLHKEFHLEKSQSTTHDFCQKCKNTEIRTAGTREEINDDSKNIVQSVWTDDKKVPGKICSSSRTLNQDSNSSENIQDIAPLSLLFKQNLLCQPCIVNDNGSHKTYGNCTDSLKPYISNCTSSLKSYNSNCTDSLKPYISNCTSSLKSYNSNCTDSLKPYISNCTSSLKSYNSNCTDSLKPYIGNCTSSLKSYNSNCTDSLKLYNSSCTSNLKPYIDKYLHNTSGKQTLSNIEPLLSQKQPQDECERLIGGDLLPVCELPSSLLYVQNQFKGRSDHSFPVNSSDQKGLSESVGWLNNLTETSTEGCLGVTSDKHGLCSCKANQSVSVSEETKSCLASVNCNVKASTSGSSCHKSHQAITASTILDNHSRDIYRMLVPCNLNPELIEEHKAQDQLPVMSDITTSQSDLDDESAESEEVASDLLVKCFSLEDKESFQHRYRLYFDDETLSQESERA